MGRKHRPLVPPELALSASEPTHDRENLELRIIGGKMRGRKLLYSGDSRTRPMKDRVREAVFNLLGPDVKGQHAIDLFAGTGALGFEAISRGAVSATLVERHFPTADVIRKNAASLDLTEVCQVLPANVLLWAKKLPPLPTTPWSVFCSPPFDFFVDRLEEMLALVGKLLDAAPPGSQFMVESDERFDFALLPFPEQWDVRRYYPALVGIYRKPLAEAGT